MANKVQGKCHLGGEIERENAHKQPSHSVLIEWVKTSTKWLCAPKDHRSVAPGFLSLQSFLARSLSRQTPPPLVFPPPLSSIAVSTSFRLIFDLVYWVIITASSPPLSIQSSSFRQLTSSFLSSNMRASMERS